MDAMDRTPRVVVGVDGSPASYEALRWGLRYARLIAGTVDAVAAYNVPDAAVDWSAPAGSAEVNEAEARQALSDEVQKAHLLDGDVPIDRHVVWGNAAEALIEASAGAELLVVGSRGLGAFTGLVLGSVSRRCASHAACPVVIVRPQTAGARDTDEDTGQGVFGRS
ncbi:universal stress protein [Streptomyces sp. NPDC003952]